MDLGPVDMAVDRVLSLATLYYTCSFMCRCLIYLKGKGLGFIVRGCPIVSRPFL
jgi:hypothetical protein